MKHSSSQEFWRYWDNQRGDGLAPDRSDFDPAPMRHLLGDVFVLSCDQSGGYPFRVAGTRVCALLGRDMKGRSFANLFRGKDSREMEDILDIVSEEILPTVAGVEAISDNGSSVPLELLLLPFGARAHSPLSLTGLLVPLAECHGQLRDFHLTSWRHIAARQKSLVPRRLRKWPIARGFMIYEGLL